MTVGDILKIILAFIHPSPLGCGHQVGFTGAFWAKTCRSWACRHLRKKWLPMIGLLLVLYANSLLSSPFYIILARSKLIA